MNDCACKISDDRTKLLSACGLHYAWARQSFGEVAREATIKECAACFNDVPNVNFIRERILALLATEQDKKP